jgi:hypothetical protein
MGGTYDLLKLPKLRKLIVQNIASRTAYEKFIIQQWETHKIEERSQALYYRALKGTFTAIDFILLNNLDRQITEILLGAEQRCSTKVVDRDKWSPKIKIGGRNILYWRARLNSISDLSSHHRKALERFRRLAMISDEEHASVLSQNGIKQKLRQAWQLHRTFQRQAADWRQKHLQERAAELAQRQNTQQAKAVKAIKHREATKQRFSRIRELTGSSSAGLSRLK